MPCADSAPIARGSCGRVAARAGPSSMLSCGGGDMPGRSVFCGRREALHAARSKSLVKLSVSWGVYYVYNGQVSVTGPLPLTPQPPPPPPPPNPDFPVATLARRLGDLGRSRPRATGGAGGSAKCFVASRNGPCGSGLLTRHRPCESAVDEAAQSLRLSGRACSRPHTVPGHRSKSTQCSSYSIRRPAMRSSR